MKDKTRKKAKKNLAEKKEKRFQNFSQQLKEHKKQTIVYFVLRIFVVITMITQFFMGNYQNVFMCILTLVLFMLPAIVEKRFNVELPDTLEIIVLLFIFSAEILGEINEFYLRIPHWDTMLHTINGFLAAAIGFALVDLLNKSDNVALSLSPFFVAVVAFCFSMTIGVMWEFFEFSMDHLFAMDMQKDAIVSSFSSVSLNPEGHNVAELISGIKDTIVVTDHGNINLGLGGYLDIGLEDTMKDLFVNFIGAFVFSIFGYIYVRNRGKGRFFKGIILRRSDTAREVPVNENIDG